MIGLRKEKNHHHHHHHLHNLAKEKRKGEDNLMIDLCDGDGFDTVGDAHAHKMNHIYVNSDNNKKQSGNYKRNIKSFCIN